MEVKEKSRRHFLIALASANLRQSSFARSINCSPQALHQFLKGRTNSKRLEKEINGFIAKEFRRLKIQA